MRSFCMAVMLLFSLPAASQDLSALFDEGMAAVEAAGTAEGDRRDELLDRAIAAFREMLVADPALVRVRLELARAFFLKGEDRLARRHFERVLAGGGASERRRQRARLPHRRSAPAGAGTCTPASPWPRTPTSAVRRTSASSTSTSAARGCRSTRDAEDLATSGIGLSVWTGGEYQVPALAIAWRLRAGADATRREYERQPVRSDLRLQLHAGPALARIPAITPKASLLASRPAALERRCAGPRRPRRPSSRPGIGSPGGSPRTPGRHGRNATYRTRDYLDGPVADISLGGSAVITPTVRADAALGWGRERPETERWRHARRWVRSGVTVALPRGFTVGASAELRETDYEGNWFPHTAGEPREDRDPFSFRASVHNRALAWQGFSPQVSRGATRCARPTPSSTTTTAPGGELRFVKLF